MSNTYDDSYWCCSKFNLKKILNPDVPINELNVLKLSGINDLPLYTLGQVKICIFGYPIIFNIILNEVSVEEDVVL